MTGWEHAVATGGPWALVTFLVVLVVTAVIRGDLVPRSVHQDLVTELTYERERNRVLEDSNRDLVMESSRLSVALTVAAIPHPEPGLTTATAEGTT